MLSPAEQAATYKGGQRAAGRLSPADASDAWPCEGEVWTAGSLAGAHC
jgi:hypothetical protein